MRCFIGLPIEEPALGAAARCLEALRTGPLGHEARFVRPEGLHVTLRFLGAIDPATAAPLSESVARELRPLAPFGVRLGGLRLFPSVRRPRVLALDLEPEAPIAEMAKAVERGVVAVGFPPEPRRFRAHLTLARLREGRRFDLAGAPSAEPLEFTARQAILFESRPERGGSLYTPLERMALGGPVSTQP